MDINELMIDTLEACKQMYYIVTRKPFLTVSKVGCESLNGGGTDSVSFTVDNEGCRDLEVQKVWFLTSYNRQVSSLLLDSGLPLPVPENRREIYSVPVAELKPALNRNVGETIKQVVLLDSSGNKSVGRFKPEVQALLAG